MLELKLEQKRYPLLEQIDASTDEQRQVLEYMSQIVYLYFQGRKNDD